MHGLRYERYGAPQEVLRIHEVDAPTPREGEVLVRVRAATANPFDWHLVRGEPFLIRMMNGIRSPKDGDVGADCAGVVELVGEGVSDFVPGDEVFGYGNGSFAELTRAKTARLARKPEGLTFEQAACIPVAGVTALHAVVTHGRLETGQRVLIIGAGGGIGSFAVQIAKALGADVTGVCSGAKVDFVRALGADDVVDYTSESVTTRPERYDLRQSVSRATTRSQRSAASWGRARNATCWPAAAPVEVRRDVCAAARIRAGAASDPFHRSHDQDVPLEPRT